MPDIFTPFDLGLEDGAEEALIFMALMGEVLEDGTGIRCPKCHSPLARLEDGRYLCERCGIIYRVG